MYLQQTKTNFDINRILAGGRELINTNAALLTSTDDVDVSHTCNIICTYTITCIPKNANSIVVFMYFILFYNFILNVFT